MTTAEAHEIRWSEATQYVDDRLDELTAEGILDPGNADAVRVAMSRVWGEIAVELSHPRAGPSLS